MRKNYGISFLLLVMLLLVSGCQVTQSAFTRTAGDAGAAFSAASTTLTYAHEGKITETYAWSSFINYQSELRGLDQTLPSQQGTPGKHTIEHLLALYKSAIQVVNNPCLEEACDWHTQVMILDRASKAFLEAGGS